MTDGLLRQSGFRWKKCPRSEYLRSRMAAHMRVSHKHDVSTLEMCIQSGFRLRGAASSVDAVESNIEVSRPAESVKNKKNDVVVLSK